MTPPEGGVPLASPPYPPPLSVILLPMHLLEGVEVGELMR